MIAETPTGPKTGPAALAAVGAPVSALAAALVLVLVGSFGPGCDARPVSDALAVARLGQMLRAENEVAYEGMRDLVWGHEAGERRRFLFVQHYAGGPSLVENAGRPGGSARRWMERMGRLYWLADKDLLLRNYLVTRVGARRISDREGLVLSVASRRPGRPSVELVVDLETSLLLAADFRDYRGRSTFRSEFRTLLIDPEMPPPPPARSWGWQRRPEDVEKWKASRQEGVPFAVLEPQHLPDGFVLKSRWKSSRGPRLNTIYSDGLTWIELSLSPAEPGSPERVVEQSRCGSRTTMHMVIQGISVRLVGSLDPAMLLEVMGSLSTRTET